MFQVKFNGTVSSLRHPYYPVFTLPPLQYSTRCRWIISYNHEGSKTHSARNKPRALSTSSISDLPQSRT